MKRLQSMQKQSGFTIIELVVVILLLGILTATALPRFISIENEAHDAVIDAIIGGMITSSGLYRAQWYAEGQPRTVVVGYDNHRPSRTGYPMGIHNVTINTLTSIPTANECVEIYTSMLQAAGRPAIAAMGSAAGEPWDEGSALLSAVGTNDFMAYLDNTNSTTQKNCYYVYTGQFQDKDDGDLPVLIYNSTTGAISLSNSSM